MTLPLSLVVSITTPSCLSAHDYRPQLWDLLTSEQANVAGIAALPVIGDLRLSGASAIPK
jgi:hypothetical protein